MAKHIIHYSLPCCCILPGCCVRVRVRVRVQVCLAECLVSLVIIFCRVLQLPLTNLLSHKPLFVFYTHTHFAVSSFSLSLSLPLSLSLNINFVCLKIAPFPPTTTNQMLHVANSKFVGIHWIFVATLLSYTPIKPTSSNKNSQFYLSIEMSGNVWLFCR